MTKRISAASLAIQLDIPKSRAIEAQMKAKLIAAVIAEARRRHLTHAHLA